MEAKAAKAGQTVLWREQTLHTNKNCPPKCEQKRVVSAAVNRRRSVGRSNRRPRDPRGTPRGLSYINRLIIGRYKKPLLRARFFAREKRIS